MKKILYLMAIGLLGLFSSCDKDETRAIMLENPVSPTFKTIPDLTLQRVNGTKMLTFVGTPVDPGFKVSANYFLEACVKGNNFVNPIALVASNQDTLMKISTSDLNGLLLKNFPADQVSAVDIRIRAVLVVDAGTGAVGTGNKQYVYSTPTKTVNVTLYGLPRLDILVGTGVTGKIESALGNGVYSGFAKLDKDNPFTLKDPDANITYGGKDGVLAPNGAAIVAPDKGWYKFTVDTKGLTYATDAYMVGLIGSATPNGWNTPDQKMDYDAATGKWKITVDLVDGEIKFRLNDGWAWNLGGTAGSLTQGGDNLKVTAGKYTITLTITGNTGSCTIVKN